LHHLSIFLDYNHKKIIRAATEWRCKFETEYFEGRKRKTSNELIYNSMVSAHQFLFPFPCNFPIDRLKVFLFLSFRLVRLMNWFSFYYFHHLEDKYSIRSLHLMSLCDINFALTKQKIEIEWKILFCLNDENVKMERKNLKRIKNVSRQISLVGRQWFANDLSRVFLMSCYKRSDVIMDKIGKDSMVDKFILNSQTRDSEQEKSR
jgi:hypothetical protein